jgi:hypothetical protein
MINVVSKALQDSVGTYRIRVCAQLEKAAVCGRRDIVVKVK